MFTSGVLIVVKRSTSVSITMLSLYILYKPHLTFTLRNFQRNEFFTFRKSAVEIQDTGVLYELHGYVCVRA